jgi:hypothetical protein
MILNPQLAIFIILCKDLFDMLITEIQNKNKILLGIFLIFI